MLELPPLSLYIHVPWCVRKCPYCDFNSHQVSGDLPEQDYLHALTHDLRQDLPYVQGRALQSIFIGGGTPSLLSAAFYEQLLLVITNNFSLAPDTEITLEANPGTVEAGRFAEYRNLGINRLSLGIQSFNDLALARLGRIHSAEDARKAIDIAQGSGFDNFNLDIM
ncbi:MAG: radical SAM protein, partial [Gammaproteobacteria bacterium]|nr:radical SAM protein [Gammaproteobacteria bacterium]